MSGMKIGQSHAVDPLVVLKLSGLVPDGEADRFVSDWRAFDILYYVYTRMPTAPCHPLFEGAVLLGQGLHTISTFLVARWREIAVVSRLRWENCYPTVPYRSRTPMDWGLKTSADWRYAGPRVNRRQPIALLAGVHRGVRRVT